MEISRIAQEVTKQFIKKANLTSELVSEVDSLDAVPNLKRSLKNTLFLNDAIGNAVSSLKRVQNFMETAVRETDVLVKKLKSDGINNEEVNRNFDLLSNFQFSQFGPGTEVELNQWRTLFVNTLKSILAAIQQSL